MAKNSITDYDNIANNNTDIQSVDIAEGCAPSGINNAIREVMADLADVNDGTVTLTSPKAATLEVTGNLTVDTNTLYVDSTNNRVGIGTLAPTEAFDVNGVIKTSAGVQLNNTDPHYIYSVGVNQIGVRFNNGATASGYMWLKNFATDVNGIGVTSGSLAFGTSGTERMRITSSGNVGIGTSSPSALMHTVGSSIGFKHTNGSVTLELYSDGTNINTIGNGPHFLGTNNANPTIFKTNNTERMRIDSSGNVGIGVSSPSNPLEITGNVRIKSASGDTQGLNISSDGSGNALINAGYSVSNMRFAINGTERMRIDSLGNVGIGTSSPATQLHIQNLSGNSESILGQYGTGTRLQAGAYSNYTAIRAYNGTNDVLAFWTGSSERMRIDSSGRLLVGTTTANIYDNSGSGGGFVFTSGWNAMNGVNDAALYLNRVASDGVIQYFFQDGSIEGNISVSGTTVSYNGGHLARWSQLTDGTKDETIVKGTVMTNLDQMAVWSHDAVEAQDAVYDEDGNVVTQAVEAKDAYTEDNEQLNCMAVSSVEGDPNVAGVFVNWDNDDDKYNDMNVAMTGDMVIRIAQGTTVARGDLLMSAGDGTAKPQGDDIVRSKTIAKVTSTNVSHTYDDGSYLVPCVLMAC